MLLAGALGVSVLGAAPLATQAIERSEPWWQARHRAKLAEARSRRIDLVLLGDSITQRWEAPAYRMAWERLHGYRQALDLGFKGDATSHLLWRIRHGEIDAIRPRAAIILIGANNMGRLRWPAEDTIAGIAAVVAEVRARLPDTKILLLAVLPSDRGPLVEAATRQINAALDARYAGGRQPGVAYLDLAPLFRLADGRIDSSQFADPAMIPPLPALHPSAAAMARMAEAMEPTLAAWMPAEP